MNAVTTSPFAELTDFLTKFIAERDERQDKGPSNTIGDAIHLLIAIENAKNICPAEKQAAKVAEFRHLIGSLQRADFSRLNLPHLIRHSIDTGTSDGWIPKLYAVNPQHVVPKSEFTVKFFGKFKYADMAKYGSKYKPTLVIGDHTFEPIEATHHRITFKPKVSEEDFAFQADKCTQIFCKLVVPYEVGVVMGSQKKFEFNVPIRALPTNPGKIEITSKIFMFSGQRSTEQVNLGWEESRTVELRSKDDSKLTFTSFDGKKQEFEAANLEADAKKSIPDPLVVQASYLRISRVAAAGEDRNKWEVTITPPVDL